MRKRLLAALLALALLAGCLCAGAAEAALPDSFIPERLVGALNDAVAYFARDVFPDLGAGEIAARVNGLKLGYVETDGSVAYYDNDEWTVESAAYYDGATDLNAPADALSVTVTDGAGDGALALFRMALAYALAGFDPAVDEEALARWMAGAVETGDMYPLGGYAVVLMRDGGAWQYALLPGERIGDEDAPASAEGDGFSPLMREGDVLLSWKGFTMQLLRVEPRARSDGSVTLAFYTRFINESPNALWLSIEDATVNGVPVEGVGETNIYRGMDSGADSGEYFFLKPSDANLKAGTDALCSAQAATMTFLLRDNDSYDDLYSQQVTISLREVAAFTPRPTAAATPRPTATPEPYRPLEILPGAYGRWEKLDDDRIGVRVEVTNTSKQEAVRAFEIHMYCTDAWGNPIYGDGTYYYAATVSWLAPGETGYCNQMVMPDCSKVSRVYAGIKEVTLSDYTVLDYGDVQYSYWDVSW